MGLFEKANSAGDIKRNVAPHQLELQLQRVEMRAIQNGHFAQIASLLAQFQDPLRYECGLLEPVVTNDEHRFGPFFARRCQFLAELLLIGADRGVGYLQDLRCAPVVGFDFVDLCLRITLREFENVLKVCAAPGINALSIIAYHHHVVMARRQQIDQVTLQFVGVLIFVHEDELKSPLILFSHLLLFLQELEPKHQQIVEVHRVGCAFARGVTLPKLFDFGPKLVKMRVLLEQNFRHRFLHVHRQGEYFRQHFGFRDPRYFFITNKIKASIHRLTQYFQTSLNDKSLSGNR